MENQEIVAENLLNNSEFWNHIVETTDTQEKFFNIVTTLEKDKNCSAVVWYLLLKILQCAIIERHQDKIICQHLTAIESQIHQLESLIKICENITQ